MVAIIKKWEIVSDIYFKMDFDDATFEVFNALARHSKKMLKHIGNKKQTNVKAKSLMKKISHDFSLGFHL